MINIFLNILIFFSPNYDKSVMMRGSVSKNLPLLDQFIFFYKSIKKNIKNINYRVSVVHTTDFNEVDKKIMDSLDIDLIKTKPLSSKNPLRCKENMYGIETKIKGTHRLIAECDMLMLKEPNFNWNVDYQAMYAGQLPDYFNVKIINKICDLYNLKKPDKKLYQNKKLYLEYCLNNTNHQSLFPFYNGGLFLLEEKFSLRLYNFIIKNKTYNLLYKPFWKSIYKHFTFQILIGLILTTLTDNWEPFQPGINYLIKIYDVNKFGKQNISLLHYCGTKSDSLVQKEFPEYFKPLKFSNKQYNQVNHKKKITKDKIFGIGLPKT